MKKRVLFLCTGNSARSQMAEGFLRHYASDRFEVSSAGVSPTLVNSFAIAVMKEIGIDISGHRSKSVTEFLSEKFDYVVTVCDNAKQVCPVMPGKYEKIHWSLQDPARAEGSEAQKAEVFRRIRGQIDKRIKDFLKQCPFPQS